jgi:hypothetical protein
MTPGFQKEVVMARTSQADHLKSWPMLITAAQVNEDVMKAQVFWEMLQESYDGANAALAEQAQLRARYQQSTRNLNDHMKTGIEAAGRIRNGARMQFGLRAEKLAEFGLKPLRPAKVTAKPVPKPPELAQEDMPTADPAADSTVQE